MGPWPKELDKEIEQQKLSIRRTTTKPLEEYLKSHDYGEGLKDLGVIPMCFKPGWMTHYKERKLYNSKNGDADFRLNIDYDSFINADEQGKRKLLIINILQAIRLIGIEAKKAGAEFDAKKMEQDIRDFLHFKVEV